MKKIKLLTPILSLTAISSAAIPLASCGQKVENITCDQKTQKIDGEYATFTFNLQDDLKSEDIAKPSSTCRQIKWWDYYIRDKKLIMKVALNLDTIANDVDEIEWDLTVYKTDNTLYGTVTGLILQFDKESRCTVNFTCSSEGVTLEDNQPVYCQPGSTWGEISKPKVKVEDGYVALGWYIEGTLTPLWDDTVIEQDMTAKYYAIKYSQYFVKVSIETTKSYAPVSYIQGGTWAGFKEYYGITQDPQKEGYTFDGWYVDNVKIDDTYVFPEGTDEVLVVAKFIQE